ncbi:MAG: ABC transporter permease [Taibaiella sp.]|nr:ABC transporter permease [Taibaiella sp.]
MGQYSNARAMRSLIKASLQSIVRSPSAIVFSIAFPLIFILVFGFLGGSKGYSIKVASAYGSDTTSQLYSILHQVPVLKWVNEPDTAKLNKILKDGDITATIKIADATAGVTPHYKVTLYAASSEENKAQQLRSVINTVMERLDPEIQKRLDQIGTVDVQISQVRDYKMIDFILPGQLGFSLLAAGVFGTAFVFFNMRQTLILKRFFATPVRREIIVLSEGIARMLFQLVGAVVIISIGYLAFGFTLLHGWVTFLQMLVICILGLMVFMGFGFIISSVAKNESSIPPLSNIITLPQFLLAGTFFPIDNFPRWLQPICRVLPLTYVNDALRKVAFDGATLMDVRMDLLWLLVWGIIVYIVAGKIFKWE